MLIKEQAMLPEVVTRPRNEPYMHGFDTCFGIVKDIIRQIENLEKEKQ